MNTEHIDIIEVFLKKDLDIPLTETEKNWYDNMDDETKQSVFALVNNISYLEELIKVMEKIKSKAIHLPKEEQQKIQEKCEEKKHSLEHQPTLKEKQKVK